MALALVLAAASLLVCACSDGLPSEFPAPDFRLDSPMSKKTVALADIKGHPAILYWFTSW